MKCSCSQLTAFGETGGGRELSYQCFLDFNHATMSIWEKQIGIGVFSHVWGSRKSERVIWEEWTVAVLHEIPK